MNPPRPDPSPAVQVREVDHVVFNVSDVERTAAWWEEHFGARPERLEEWRRGEVPFASVRINEGTILDLFPAERTGENVNHVAVRVDDVDLQAVADSGRFDVVGGPAELFGARGTGTGLYIHDPDGNTVELRTYG